MLSRRIMGAPRPTRLSAGFLLAAKRESDRSRMSNDMWDWVKLGILAVVHLVPLVPELVRKPRRRSRRVERFRSFRGWGIEWTAYDREDDPQS
jgi:hypothetical protein